MSSNSTNTNSTKKKIGDKAEKCNIENLLFNSKKINNGVFIYQFFLQKICLPPRKPSKTQLKIKNVKSYSSKTNAATCTISYIVQGFCIF